MSDVVAIPGNPVLRSVQDVTIRAGDAAVGLLGGAGSVNVTAVRLSCASPIDVPTERRLLEYEVMSRDLTSAVLGHLNVSLDEPQRAGPVI